MLRLTAAILLAAAAVLAGPLSAAADPPPPPGYLEAVDQAYAIIAHASPSATGPADAAYRVTPMRRLAVLRETKHPAEPDGFRTVSIRTEA